MVVARIAPVPRHAFRHRHQNVNWEPSSQTAWTVLSDRLDCAAACAREYVCGVIGLSDRSVRLWSAPTRAG
jgi:hypothetical protein